MIFKKKGMKKKHVQKKTVKPELDKSERFERGHLHVRTIIEMVGKPKEYLEETLKTYVKEIEKAFEVMKKTFGKPKKVEGKMLSTFVEIEMWAKSPSDVIGFGFDYMPSSIEIMEPEHLKYTAGEFTGMLNDMQGKLYKVDTEYKKVRKENEILNNNLSNTLRNLVMLSVATNRHTPKEISVITGVHEKNLKGIMDTLVAEKKLVKRGDRYELSTP